MSYPFDTASRVFREKIRPLLKTDGKEDLADAFEDFLELVHSANHGVPSADGIFKGDGVAKAPGMDRLAKRLERCANGDAEWWKDAP